MPIWYSSYKKKGYKIVKENEDSGDDSRSWSTSRRKVVGRVEGREFSPDRNA